MDNDGAKQRHHQTAFKAVLCLAVLLPVLAAVLFILPSLSLAQPAPGTDTFTVRLPASRARGESVRPVS